MEPELKFNLKSIINIDDIVKRELKRFQELKELVKDLKFVPVDPIGTYSSVTYKSVDGGKMGIHFDPFEFDFVIIADSIGNQLMSYLVPKADKLTSLDFLFLDKFPQVKRFLEILGEPSLSTTSNILSNAQVAMELTEYACIFDKLTRSRDEPVIIMKDGLLRTIALKPECIKKLIDVLKSYKRAKLIGVAKSSRVLNLISAALFISNMIPFGYTGFIEIPWEIEKLAYKWVERGVPISNNYNHLYHAFGKLYVVKLSKVSNLLVTIEIPYDFENDMEVYSKREVYELIGHLIKDSAGSYPILGYPQTIMRAHEKAVRFGFTASIWQDKIIQRILDALKDENIKKLIIENNYLRDYVDKGMLGGF